MAADAFFFTCGFLNVYSYILQVCQAEVLCLHLALALEIDDST